MMEDATPPWLLEVAGNLLQAHVDIQQTIVDAEGFRAALIKALSEAYEQGLEDGLRASRPDA
jgi:hypothetical protein